MNLEYPVLIIKDKHDYLVYIPDIDRMTSGSTFNDAIFMARDLLGTWNLDYPLPQPSSATAAIQITKEKADEDEFKWSDGKLIYVSIDPEEYQHRLHYAKGLEESLESDE